MLATTIAGTALIASLSCGTCPPAGATSVALSGTAVRAIHAAYGAIADRVFSDIGTATVSIAKNHEMVEFVFPRNGHAAICVDTVETVEEVSCKNIGAHAVTIPGPDAKAIAMAYDAWLSENVMGRTKGTLGVPPLGDVRSGDFRIQERFYAGPPVTKSGYIITYLPLIPSPKRGIGCASFINYRVDDKTWQVFVEPKIC